MSQPRRIFFKYPSSLQPFTEDMPFTFHFAAFRSLRAESSELLAQSYTEGPVPALKGRTTFELDPVMMAVVGILHKQTTSFGEQSSWQMTDGGDEITIFIEVLSAEEPPFLLFHHYDQFQKLVRHYWSSLLPSHVKRQYTADQEVRDYICIVFYVHWVRQDLSTVVDPRLGTKTPEERRVVAQELGFQTRQALGRFVNMVMEIDKDAN